MVSGIIEFFKTLVRFLYQFFILFLVVEQILNKDALKHCMNRSSIKYFLSQTTSAYTLVIIVIYLYVIYHLPF